MYDKNQKHIQAHQITLYEMIRKKIIQTFAGLCSGEKVFYPKDSEIDKILKI